MKLHKLSGIYIKPVGGLNDSNTEVFTDGSKDYVFVKVKLNADGERLHGIKELWNVVAIREFNRFQVPALVDCGVYVDRGTLDTLVKAGIYTRKCAFSDLINAERKDIGRARTRIINYCALRDMLDEIALYTDSEKALGKIEKIRYKLCHSILVAPNTPEEDS